MDVKRPTFVTCAGGEIYKTQYWKVWKWVFTEGPKGMGENPTVPRWKS